MNEFEVHYYWLDDGARLRLCQQVGSNGPIDAVRVVTLDRRRRVSFGKIGRPEHTRYIATVAEDGTIYLVPADIVPAAPVEVRS